MKKLAILFTLVATSASADSAAIDRLGGTIGQCIVLAETKVDQVNTLTAKVAELEAELKALKEKQGTK
jgi:hypothetical protein